MSITPTASVDPNLHVAPTYENVEDAAVKDKKHVCISSCLINCCGRVRERQDVHDESISQRVNNISKRVLPSEQEKCCCAIV